MAFTVQDQDGNVDGANAYVDVAELKSFQLDRGVDLSATYTDAQLQVAIVKATSFLDARYTFIGYKLRKDQGTQWPRGGVTTFLKGLPSELRAACCLLAQRSASGKVLMPDPTYDASGAQVVESTKKVGPIEVTTKFAQSSPGRPTASVPDYPEVTLMLRAAGLTESSLSGGVVRG